MHATLKQNYVYQFKHIESAPTLFFLFFFSFFSPQKSFIIESCRLSLKRTAENAALCGRPLLTTKDSFRAFKPLRNVSGACLLLLTTDYVYLP